MSVWNGGPPKPFGLAAATGLSSSVAVAERFAIRWKGFQSNMTDALEELQTGSDFADVILASEDGLQLKAHRLILAVGSDYFRKVLKELPMEHSCGAQHPTIVLPGVSGTVLKALMHYFYHGEANVEHSALDSFLHVAGSLSVKGMIAATPPKPTSESFAFPPPPPPPPNFHLPFNTQLPLAPQPLSVLASPLHQQPVEGASDNGLSILAHAAANATTFHNKNGAVFRACRRRGTDTSSESGIQMTENDENSPMNYNNNLNSCKAINLSIRDNVATSAPSPVPLGLLTIPDPSFLRLKTHHQPEASVPDIPTNQQNLLSPAPLAIDMTAATGSIHQPVNPGSLNFSNATSPFSGSSGGGMCEASSPEGVPSCVDGSSTSVGSPLPNSKGSPPPAVVPMALSSTTKKKGDKRSKKRNCESGKDARSDMLCEDVTGAVVDEDFVDEGGSVSGDKAWKSRQPRCCQHCGRVFSNKFNLKQHVLNMHTDGGSVECSLCHKRVKNKWYLRRHHVTHHGAPLKK